MEYNSEGLALFNEFQSVAELSVIEMYNYFERRQIHLKASDTT